MARKIKQVKRIEAVDPLYRPDVLRHYVEAALRRLLLVLLAVNC